MEAVLNFLGFTTPEGIVWNSLAYGAILAIIYAVLHEKGRYWVFAVAGATLAFYSHFFLQSILFTTLQIVVTISALLQALKVSVFSQKVSLTLLTLGALLFLFIEGYLSTILNILGALGFLGVALGIIMLPRLSAFPLMALGGLMLVLYAFATNAWAFFILNIFYTAANIWQWITIKDKEDRELACYDG